MYDLIFYFGKKNKINGMNKGSHKLNHHSKIPASRPLIILDRIYRVACSSPKDIKAYGSKTDDKRDNACQ